MLDTRIILAGLWVATMLTYLWGDVLRIFAGDFEPGKLTGTGGGELTPVDWTVFRHFLVQLDGQSLLLSPLGLEFGRGEIPQRRMDTFVEVHIIKEAA